MGKNTKLYRYLELGLKWDSWILKRIERDGDHHQMGDQLGKLAALRLVEYYTLVDAGLIVPGLSMVNAQAAQAPSQQSVRPVASEPEPEYRSSRGRQRERQVQPAPVVPVVEDTSLIEESEFVDDNADALLDQMFDDDDE